ncbi:MAG: inositol monophosphatase [Ignavibacteriae bacterium]|nr:inositol monophosphatase [Ignavibacteriota bacterium]
MFNQLTNCAVDSALKAGKILKEGFGTSFEIFNKIGKNNLVTEYDKRSESIIIENIKSVFPDHSFVAEESGNSGNIDNDSIKWVIDPLDGTVNFAHSLPIFSVSIAAVKNKEILCGVVYHPILDELFIAEKGTGSFLNDKPIKVSKSTELDSAFLVTGFPYNVNSNPCGCIDHFVSIIQRGIPVRRLGSAALDLAYVACGRFDGFWEINLHSWDVAAGVIIVQEAGGIVTQYNNEKYWLDNQTLIATNGKIHNQICNVLIKCGCGINFGRNQK